MKSVSFLEAMIATHLAYVLVAVAAALFLRGIRRSLERMAGDVEAQLPSTMRDD